MASMLDKIPERHKSDVKAFLTAVRDASDYKSGCQRTKGLVNKQKKIFLGL